MKPVLAIVGRPNVGKSTLFNRMTKSRDAIVADFSGLTRDRHYGDGRSGEHAFIVVDTGGFEPDSTSGIVQKMAEQTRQAVAEADAVIFVVDVRSGVTGQDHDIARYLRSVGKKVVLAVNKAEGMQESPLWAEFFELGLGDPMPVSAAHGQGIRSLTDAALAHVVFDEVEEAPPAEGTPIRLAVAGRPNVGKSTLINTWLGEERLVAFDQPGTTRDAITVPFERQGQKFELIDTAGLRRRGKVFEAIEKFSVIKTLQAIEDANVVVLLLDAEHAITEQDAHLAGHILEAGRAVVVGINKWDAVASEERDQVKRDLDRKMAFLSFAQFHFMSAREGKGVGQLLKSVDLAFAAAMAKLPTPRLTRTLQLAVERQQPPRAGLVRPKLRYAHQGGVNPPLIIIHGTALHQVPDAYRRYLEHFFSDAFQLRGTPLRIQFKVGANPYADVQARR